MKRVEGDYENCVVKPKFLVSFRKTFFVKIDISRTGDDNARHLNREKGRSQLYLQIPEML